VRWWVPLFVGVVVVTACGDDTDATPAPEVPSSVPADEASGLTPDQPDSPDDSAAPAPEDTASADPASGPGRELLGYRAGLYPTDFSTERKSLSGTHEIVDASFPRDVTIDDIEIETIDMPFPALMDTRDDDEIPDTSISHCQ
jgi:hypothetical protein